MPTAPRNHPLAPYWAKRDFSVTSEPRGEQAGAGGDLSFVVQKHAASRLHYDFRLEFGGVLLSWAVPKGPSLDPADKRLAVQVEDHPLSYGGFEGTIPPGQYGAGQVIVWDRGYWEPVGDPRRGLAQGKLVFDLHGEKLEGRWELVRLAKKDGDRQQPWLLFKKRDEFARAKAEVDIVKDFPDSVIAKPAAAKKAVAKKAVATKAAAKKTAGARAPGNGARQGTSDVGTPTSGGAKAKLPETLSPQLATLVSGLPPASAGPWVFESKYDGYRVLARIDTKGRAALITRGGHDWSAKLPKLKQALEQLGVKSTWLDGEIVLHGENGLPDFNALQNAFERSAPNPRIVYFLFDLPFFEGHDLRGQPLSGRRGLLKAMLDERAPEGGLLRFSESLDADAAEILAAACKMNLEGVMAKRADSTYTGGRGEDWLKLKCQQRQEFVVCGYTDRSDGTARVGSLLLGVHEGRGGALLPVGGVGTGWSSAEAAKLLKLLSKTATASPPFRPGEEKKLQAGRWTKRKAEAIHWVEPRLVAEVAFAGWTPDGQLRHASYVALRADKPANEVVRETSATPADVAAAAPTAPRRRRAPAQAGAAGHIAITHGERVVDPSTGATKRDLVRYYESIAEWMLPHLKGRPCALMRAPQGIKGHLFFQKHAEKTEIPGVKLLDPALDPGHEALLEIASAEALVGAAQMNVFEFHTWGALARSIDKPDRMVFDLDPGEGTAWPQVREAAVLVRGFLADLGLASWLKTSGGKGLHVVVPLAPRRDAATVKAFSKAIVEHMSRAIPSRFVAKSGPANRVGKLFIDYLRNGHGATTVAAFSARARPGLGVSMPVSWDELDALESSAQWTIADARERLSFQTEDPWADYWGAKQTLTGAMKMLGFKGGGQAE